MVSTKGRYALRVMIELAVRRDEGVVCLKEIAEHQQISEKYLEAIVKSLVSAGLVIGPVNCRDDDCPRHGNCATLPMWRELNRIIDDYFQGISLEQLTAQALALGDTGVV